MIKLLPIILMILINNYCFSIEKNAYFGLTPDSQQKFEEFTHHGEFTKLLLTFRGDLSNLDLSSLSNVTTLEDLTVSAGPDFDPKDPYNPRFLWKLPSMPSLKKLTMQGFYFISNDSEKISHLLDSNPQLESLDISYADLDTKDPVGLFLGLKHLKKLALRRTFLGLLGNSDSLSHLYEFHSLMSLDVRDNPFLKPDDFSMILNLPQLEELYIGGRPWSISNFHSSLGLLERHFHSMAESNILKTLVFENVITDSVDFSHLAPNLSQLALINVTGTIDWRKLQNNQKLEILQLTDIILDSSNIELINLVSLIDLKKFISNSAKGINIPHLMPYVKELYLANSNITGGDLKKIGQLPSVEILDISHTSLNGTSLTHLKNLTNLKKLSMNALNISTGDLNHLKNLSNLEELSLSEATLSLAQLNTLEEFTWLKRLDLSKMGNPNIKQAEILNLQQKMPHTEIISGFLILNK